MYRNAKKQIEAGKAAVDKEKIAKRDEDRRLAVDYSEKAVKALEANDAATTDSLRRCKLSLATIYSEGKDYKLAAAQYKPLVRRIARQEVEQADRRNRAADLRGRRPGLPANGRHGKRRRPRHGFPAARAR